MMPDHAHDDSVVAALLTFGLSARDARQRTFDVGLGCQPPQHRCSTVVPEQGYFSPNTGSLADVSC